MKKYIIALLAIVLLFPVSSVAKKKVFKYNFTIVSERTERGKHIGFSCLVLPKYSYFVRNFQLTNNNDEKLSIVWENARFGESKLVFGSDSKHDLAQQKADEVVYPHSKSQRRDITGWDNVFDPRGLTDNYFSAILPFAKLRANVYEEASVDIILPIKYADGTEEDFVLRITGYYTYEE